MQKSLVRKGLVVGIIVLFIGAGVVPLIRGTNVEKHNSIDDSVSFMGFNSRGDILYVGGSGTGNYSTIQSAIDDASDGDTVFVYDDSSPYYENVVVDKSINLIGENRETTIIDGSGFGTPVIIARSFVTMTSFTVQNCEYDIPGEDGIQVYNKENINISNCIFKDNLGLNSDGIYFDKVINSYITNCYSYNNIWSGINLVTCENIIIEYCTSENNGVGIRIWFSSDNITITECNLYNNGCGIQVSFPKNIEIYHNIICSNGGYGIFIRDSKLCYNVIIHNNTISENGNGGFYDGGFLIQDCTKHVIIKNNNISSNNPHGIYHIRSYGNKIYENNFINNPINAYFLNKILPNCWKRNFWDDWIGLKIIVFEKFPRIIIGSYNFKIPWINFDWHPAKEPYDIPQVAI